MEESAEDITAAETAPKPITPTAVGVKCWRTNGRTSAAALTSTGFTPYVVSFQPKILTLLCYTALYTYTIIIG